MGVLERKERERQEMRQLILEKAKAVFIEEGYEKASIRAIAERIEYSPATIYLYFKDKDELFHAVHELGFEKLFAEMAVHETLENPLEQLRQLGYTYLKFALNNPELYDLMFISRAPMAAIFKMDDNEADWHCGHKTFLVLCNTLTRCLDGGHIRPMPLQIATMAIWSFVHGMASLHIRGRFKTFGELDTEAAMDASLEQMILLIKA